MRQRLLMMGALFLLLVKPCFTEQIIIRNAAELVKPAHLIARVKILSVSGGNSAQRPIQVALAEIIDPIKGAIAGAKFDLEFNDAVICPYVAFARGEDVLLFAMRQESGRYVSLYSGAGKYLINSNRLPAWKLGKDTNYVEVRAQILRLLTEGSNIRSIEPKLTKKRATKK